MDRDNNIRNQKYNILIKSKKGPGTEYTIIPNYSRDKQIYITGF